MDDNDCGSLNSNKFNNFSDELPKDSKMINSIKSNNKINLPILTDLKKSYNINPKDVDDEKEKYFRQEKTIRTGNIGSSNSNIINGKTF